MTISQAEFFASSVAAQTDPRVDAIKSDLISVVERDWAAHPRSLQKEIGPSEAGVRCPRQLAAKLVDATRVNAAGDLLPAFIGVAGHAKLEEAFAADNARIVADGGEPRWLIEQRVEAAPNLTGSCDLFDQIEGRAIDHKFLSPSTFREYKKSGPPEHYVKQAMLYGAGWVRAGYVVNEVAIWMLPRAGGIAGSYLWTAPFDQDVADATVDRLNLVRVAVDGIGAAGDHSKLELIPAKPDKSCKFCFVYSSTPRDGVWSCPGR